MNDNRIELSAGELEQVDGGRAKIYCYEHVVVAGDTVSDLAKQYKTTVTDICWANKLTDPNTIYIGQVLLIPYAKG